MGDLESSRDPVLSAPTPITEGHVTAGFASGNSTLDDWLGQKAWKSEGQTARTYVVCHGNRVVGYYGIAMGAVQRNLSPGKVRRNAPDPIPVAVLARLAVDATYQGQGIGAGMLKDACKRILMAAEIIGVRAILVHAIDEPARAFYARYGFAAYPDGTLTMFLPLETIVDAL